MAQRIRQRALDNPLTKNAIIIRMYSVETEFQIISHQAEGIQDAAPAETEDFMAELASFRVAMNYTIATRKL